ncbi:MAG: bifunctional adenosylcobinamide kinase/adenosylcobinamide-phosphate guanylyltransferase [Phycisphaeraceae bacterium]|nr:bifunctional adenosylcobinamide kinase/adenosylcobinamide-phosphate guanylyltransferase [Phycisphaeraceae bacterium]
MAHIVLITGGCRSGKSGYAQQLAESLPGRRVYIATCPVLDDEMRRRIDLHRQAREGKAWQTIEESMDLPGVLDQARSFDVVLVDCLTLWVSNVMFDAQQRSLEIDEHRMVLRSQAVLKACSGHPGTIVFVTNEVGMGIVPENALARRFRDLAGRCNQTMAAGADRVVLMACGLPLNLKGS